MNKTEKLCLAVTIILLLTSSALLAWFHMQGEPSLETTIKERLAHDINKIGIALEINVTGPDGKLKSSLHRDDDLILANFINMTKGVLTDSNGANPLSASVTDTGGTIRTLNIKTNLQDFSSHSILHSGPTSSNKGGAIQIGTGSTSPARSDTNLVTGVESLTAVGTPTYNNGNVTASAAIAVTADRSIREAGFFCTWSIGSSSVANFLLFRDVFDAVAVTTGDTCTVTYTTYLSSTGFNNNFGTILAELFENVIDGGDTTISLTDISGSAQTVNAWGDTNTQLLFDTDVANPSSGIQVGTDSSTVGRSNYTLGTAVESLTANSVPVISGTSNITTAAVITMSTDRTITEAGFYIKSKNTAGTDKTFMLWRTTFEGVAVSNGNTITITFIIILIVIPIDFLKKREEYTF